MTGLAPKSGAGLARVVRCHVGTLSAVINSAHQLGGVMGLGMLLAVSVVPAPPAIVALVARVSTALSRGSLPL